MFTTNARINLLNGSGFVHFEDKYDAKDAVRDLDGKDLCGQRIRVELSNVNFYITFSKTSMAYSILVLDEKKC